MNIMKIFTSFYKTLNIISMFLTITVLHAHAVHAATAHVKRVSIGNESFFGTIQNAYDNNETQNNDQIICHSDMATESVILNRGISFKLLGGYDAQFQSTTGYTTLNNLTINAGTAIINRIAIGPGICGNGIVDANEQCDDGNLANVDGCSSACRVESGYYCTGSPSSCVSTCGDGFVAFGIEQCDDGNKINTDGCSSSCTVEQGFICISSPSVCTKTCTPKTCSQLNLNCGAVADGCGGTIDCGQCSNGQTCGGGGTPNVCGSGSPCTPKTCSELGLNCGSTSDGCGGTIACGVCYNGLICGGDGTPNVCGFPGFPSFP